MATTPARRLGFWLAKIVWFVGLFYIGARVTVFLPEKLISLYTAERFATWVHGYSSQENFDDLWVLTWLLSSLVFAVVGYLLTLWIIRKVRR